jgi:hypothetical protein
MQHLDGFPVRDLYRECLQCSHVNVAITPLRIASVRLFAGKCGGLVDWSKYRLKVSNDKEQHAGNALNGQRARLCSSTAAGGPSCLQAVLEGVH